MKTSCKFLVSLTALLMALPIWAHHSYAMFDTSRAVSVTGTAAKLEWDNPHIFLWVYVPDKKQASGFQLYGFETGSLVLMARQGWDRHAVKVGEKLTVAYLPLKNGDPGGALLRVTKADGSVLNGDPFGAKPAKQSDAKEVK